MYKEVLTKALSEAIQYFESLNGIRIGVNTPIEELKSFVDANLPDEGEAPEIAINKLISGVKKGLIHSQNARYFGFVCKRIQ